jgi:hypothetical protein
VNHVPDRGIARLGVTAHDAGESSARPIDGDIVGGA